MRLAIPLLALLLALPSVLAGPPGALVLPAGELPGARFSAVAGALDGDIVVAGGVEHVCYCFLLDVVRFDPDTGASSIVATLPRDPDTWAWAFDGASFHAIGRDVVFHVDARTGTITESPGVVTREVAASQAAWLDGRVWLFHGGSPVRAYDPATGELETMSARVPRVSAMAVVPADGVIHLLGGENAWPGMMSDRVYRYDPATDTLEERSARLPLPLAGMAAAWTGEEILLMGGWARADPATPVALANVIMRYDPRADEAALVAAALPTPTIDAAATSIDGRVFVMGGSCLPCVPTSAPPVSSEDPTVHAAGAFTQSARVYAVQRVP